jgi:hypothetical protein
MILIIRGHIRNSFETANLYYFVESIINLCPDLKIFIHTWNIFSNGISWRKIDIDNNIVNEDVIYNYFNKIQHHIKHIIIDDDTNIKLIGNLDGNINGGPMPIIGWKNYWYSKHKITKYIYNQDIYNDELTINCRFDIINNSNGFPHDCCLDFVKKNINTKITKNIFLFDNEGHGVDNIYLGNIITMYKLSCKFFYELDDILYENIDTIHQEKLVFRINLRLFD